MYAYFLLKTFFVALIIFMSQEIERKRRLEEAIVHRKRSSRIANKEMEKEEARAAARQKAEVAEKKNRAQRLEARLAKEEAERERREAAREQRRRDKEAQEEQDAAEKEDERSVSTCSLVFGSGFDPSLARRCMLMLWGLTLLQYISVTFRKTESLPQVLRRAVLARLWVMIGS